MQCEVCGGEFKQLRWHNHGFPTDELCGPMFEEREHWRADDLGTHSWYQYHNCVHPEPDRCYFCPGFEPEKLRLPACCR